MRRGSPTGAVQPCQRRRRDPVRRGRTQPSLPGRADRRAEDREGLRAAWAALERTWAATLARVVSMPAGTVDIRWAASGRSRRHCGTWSWPRTCGWAGHPGDRAAVPPHRPRGPGTEEDGLDSRLRDGDSVVRRGARDPGGPRRDGARLPRHGHAGRTGRYARKPVDPEGQETTPRVCT